MRDAQHSHFTKQTPPTPVRIIKPESQHEYNTIKHSSCIWNPRDYHLHLIHHCACNLQSWTKERLQGWVRSWSEEASITNRRARLSNEPR